jgi:hypothetical protein
MEEAACPIACSLSTAEFRARRSEILKKIVPAIIATKELEDGFAFRFPADDEWLLELTQFVIFERQCCPFLNFKLTVEANGTSVWLELTGRQGAKEFVASLLN